MNTPPLSNVAIGIVPETTATPPAGSLTQPMTQAVAKTGAAAKTFSTAEGREWQQQANYWRNRAVTAEAQLAEDQQRLMSRDREVRHWQEEFANTLAHAIATKAAVDLNQRDQKIAPSLAAMHQQLEEAARALQVELGKGNKTDAELQPYFARLSEIIALQKAKLTYFGEFEQVAEKAKQLQEESPQSLSDLFKKLEQLTELLQKTQEEWHPSEATPEKVLSRLERIIDLQNQKIDCIDRLRRVTNQLYQKYQDEYSRAAAQLATSKVNLKGQIHPVHLDALIQSSAQAIQINLLQQQVTKLQEQNKLLLNREQIQRDIDIARRRYDESRERSMQLGAPLAAAPLSSYRPSAHPHHFLACPLPYFPYPAVNTESMQSYVSLCRGTSSMLKEASEIIERLRPKAAPAAATTAGSPQIPSSATAAASTAGESRLPTMAASAAAAASENPPPLLPAPAAPATSGPMDATETPPSRKRPDSHPKPPHKYGYY